MELFSARDNFKRPSYFGDLSVPSGGKVNDRCVATGPCKKERKGQKRKKKGLGKFGYNFLFCY